MTDLDILMRHKVKKPSEKKKTVVELKAECKSLGIKGYSKMKRDELIELLTEHKPSDEATPKVLDSEIGLTPKIVVKMNNTKAGKKKKKKEKRRTILDGLIENKNRIEISKFHKDGKDYFWHPDSKIVFSESIGYSETARKKAERKYAIAVARVDENGEVVELNDVAIGVCKFYGFEYIIPDVLTEITNLENIKVEELDEDLNDDELFGDDDYDDEVDEEDVEF